MTVAWSLAAFLAGFSTAVCAEPALAQAPQQEIECSEGGTGQKKQQIAGGMNADVRDYPFIVHLTVQGEKGAEFCGGALVGRGWVLTAAHCATNRFALRGEPGYVRPEEAFTVTRPDALGRAHGAPRTISNVFVHPDFDWNTLDSDIALLRLEQPYEDDLATPLAIATEQIDRTYASGGACARVAGWGLTHVLDDNNQVLVSGDPTDRLQELNLSIASDADCTAKYPGKVTRRMLCVGDGIQGRNTCKGDSGGPLIADIAGTPIILGVVSWAYGCAQAEHYTIFARVGAKPVRDWLIDVATGGGR